jgi:5'-AMP-activated protein kinase catalytic alpha subunit
MEPTLKNADLDETIVRQSSTQKTNNIKEIGKVKIFLNKPLGAGVTSKVYEGVYTYDKDKKMKREVAVKCIEKNKIAEFGVDFERYLQNEFEVINKLKHRNIVEYIDFFSSKACYYFVFEKC